MTTTCSGSSTLTVLENEHLALSLRCRSPRPSSPAVLYEMENEITEKPSLKAKPTPLPRLQVSILLFMLLSEPCTAAVLLPFINNLVYEVGITKGDKSKIGYYAGLIESLFFMTESLFILQYGRLSDRIGRRPVLFFGLAGLVLSSLCFGMSKSFTGILVSRALAGALNGNAGVIKSVLREVTDETNAAQVFAFIPMIWSLGFTFAPAVGGLLQHPAETMPRVFGWSSVLKRYPYLLPCTVIALVPATALIMGWLFLKETHPILGKTQRSDMYQLVDSNSSSITLVFPEHSEFMESKLAPPPLVSLLTPRVCITILNYALLALLDISIMALQPIVFASPIALGGFGMEPASIGLILALQGIVTGVVTAIFVPRMQKYFGMRKLYMGAVCLYFVQIWLLPVMHYAVKYSVGGGIGFMVLVGVYAVVSCASPISFCCLLLFISNAPPDHLSLGATNGLAQTSASIMRAIGPAITTSLFALSAGSSTKGTLMVYLILSGANGLCIIGGMLIRPEWTMTESRTS
ncbi:hypothetical protein FRC12_013974 [Ceratobasidium sp. 428]|nr:hypothetical protein FRC12_013974 [Ceratobasidium sp. 428]